MRSSKLLDALQNLINYKPSYAEIAKIIGVGGSAIGNRVARDANFSDEEIEKIERYYAIELSPSSNANTVELEYIHIQPSCGTGTVLLDDAEVTPVKIGREIIKDIWKSTPESLKLFKASGDSMENTIEDGNILLVDTSKTDFNSGGVFVLTINNEWFVKRLCKRLTGDLDVISDNPKYRTETFSQEDFVEIVVVGKVIKNLSKGL